MNLRKLLLYGTTWRYPRNQLFLNSLKYYFDVKLLTSKPPDNSIKDLLDFDRYNSGRFINYKSVGLSICPNFKEFINDFKPDYVLTIEPHTLSSFQSIYYSKLFNYKSIIFSWQNLLSIPKYCIQKKILDYNKKRCWLFLAGTIDVKNYYLSNSIQEEMISICPETGFDEEIFTTVGNNFREEWNLENEDKVILYAGRIHVEKGIKQILEVSRYFINSKNIKFIFVGDGPHKEMIKNYYNENILLLPKIDYAQMPKLYRTADIVLYPSLTQPYWKEQFGYSVIEANACGKPVITTRSGSLRHLVKENINGSQFDENNVMALHDCIKLWLHKLSDNVYSKNIRNHIEIFSNKSIASIYYNIIQNPHENYYQNSWF